MSDATAPLDILILSDLHCSCSEATPNPMPGGGGAWARLFALRALEQLRQEGREPGLILLLGDLVADGHAPGAESVWMQLAGELLATGIPVLALPGNHDERPDRVAALFNTPPGLRRIGGYGFLVFHDRRIDGDHYARTDADLALPDAIAAAHPGLPLIALQHNPIFPAIDSPYPYRLDNAAAVADSYRSAGVSLSLSGHYHPGAGPAVRDGTTYLTAPALGDPPFAFLHLRLDGTQATFTRHTLRHEQPGLCDCHCHTEFAYCGTTISSANGIALSRMLGLDRVCLVDHTFQLYFPKPYAWTFKWPYEPEAVAAAWASPGRSRMAAFQAFARAIRSPFARIGLEVDLYGDGQLLLAPEDAGGWDILLGGIHVIAGVTRGVTPQAEAEKRFMRDVEAYLASPVQVLAHLFRFFPSNGYQKPEHLYTVLADRLAATGKAAELNFHGNEPEPPFFRACLERGVKIALGTDSHSISQPGDLARHLRFLHSLGVTDADLPDVLFMR
jgi:histidinol phosphatase-like PHP family hydrolase